VHLAPYTGPAFVDVIVAVGLRRRVFAPAAAAAYRTFACTIAAAARRDAPAADTLAILTSSRALFDLYQGPGGDAASYGRICSVLRVALPRLRDPYLNVDALCANIATRTIHDTCILSGPRVAPLPDADAYVLLASFIASRSPRDRDSRLFLRAYEPGHKRRRERRDLTKVATDGPQPALLNRLLSIHAYLTAEHLGTIQEVRDPRTLLALANLVSRNLIERVSPLDDLANPRFTCLLDAGPAFDLAATVRLPLGRYLPT